MGLKLAWRWILYIKLCCTKKLGLLPTILYIGLVVSFGYLSFVQAWTAGLKVMWCVVQNVWDVMMVANVNMLYICFLRVFRSIAVALAPDCLYMNVMYVVISWACGHQILSQIWIWCSNFSSTLHCLPIHLAQHRVYKDDSARFLQWVMEMLKCQDYSSSDDHHMFCMSLSLWLVLYQSSSMNLIMTTHAAQCTSGQFRCDNGQCVSSSVWCNGYTGGCTDGSDERGQQNIRRAYVLRIA